MIMMIIIIMTMMMIIIITMIIITIIDIVPRTVSNTHARVQLIGRSSLTTCLPLGTKGQPSYDHLTELKRHLF